MNSATQPDVETIHYFDVLVIRALRGGGYTSYIDAAKLDRQSAIRRAESLQARFAEECWPVRCYVAARDGVPVYAAGRPAWMRDIWSA
jgi:hypothetical protein